MKQNSVGSLFPSPITNPLSPKKFSYVTPL